MFKASKIILTSLFLVTFIGAPAWASKKEQVKKEPTKKASKNFVVMKNRSTGETLRFAEVSPAELQKDFASSEVHLPRWMKSCSKDRSTASLQSVELELELGFLIESLQELAKPRLTKSQKDLILSVPLCQNYLIKLKIIALLLQEFHLVQGLDSETLASL